VKRRLLGLRLLYQSIDPVKHRLISESGRQKLVMSDLFVELETLLIHCLSAFQIKTAAAQISFNAGTMANPALKERGRQLRRPFTASTGGLRLA
jgi:hypothetical protein